MASLTPQVSNGTTPNPAIAGGLQNITSSGGVNAYFQPSPVNFLNSAPTNSNVAQSLLGGGQLVSSGNAAPKVTTTGGTSFNPQYAAGYNNTPVASPAPVASTKPPLDSLFLGSNTTPNGGTLSTSGGTPTGYTPSPFSINPSNTVSSSAFNSPSSVNDVMNQQRSLQDYVNAVAQANGYSPQYISALQGQYGAQTQGAQLGLNQAEYGLQNAALNSNYYTGNNLPGDTLSYAQGATAKAQAQNTLQQAGNTVGQAENSIQQLSANQALNTAQLQRTGNIAGAQAQLQYSPGAVSQQNALAQYNALQQQYPSAGLPPVDPNGDLYAQLQAAHQTVAQSPAYQAQFQSTYSTPAGGTGIYNKLNTGSLPQNSDGTVSLVSGAAATAGGTAATNYNQLATQYNGLVVPYTAANNDFTAMTNFMQKAGINADTSTPLINQVTNAVKANVLDPSAVAVFKTYIASLRTNYAQLLGARGETPTQAGADANTLVPDTLNVQGMQQVQQALNTNGKNIIDATGNQMSGLYQTIQGGGPQNSQFNPGGQTGGNIYDF